ncbi:MAG: hypothetical protein JXA10_01510 [Anaerolineae bacterium]|nr:hypothetical protein [Anaerolineae bacterium]
MPKTVRQPPPATPAMVARLTINRTGQFTPGQRRLSLIVGLGALGLFLCPLAMLAQLIAVLFANNAPAITMSGVVIIVIGVLFLIMFAGMVGTNAQTFLTETFMRRPVHHARGPLEIRVSEGNRPELPFSYIIGDYSFAPYVVPAELPMVAGAPYIAYYAARSRLLLSIAALDAPDGAQWLPPEEHEKRI